MIAGEHQTDTGKQGIQMPDDLGVCAPMPVLVDAKEHQENGDQCPCQKAGSAPGGPAEADVNKIIEE